MSVTTVVPATADSSVTESHLTLDRPFDSIDAMRDEHTKLLKIFYSEGSTLAVIDLVKAFLKRGELSGKNFDRGDERLEAQRILDQWGTVLTKAGLKEVDATLAGFEGKDLSGQTCPYVGLNPFGEKDHSFFYGRTQLRKDALDILANERFLAIVGPSGSGKSSLVLGGILPDLHDDALPSSSSWIYIPPLVPGATPLDSLVHALRGCPSLLPQDFEPSRLLEQPELLSELIRPAAAGRSALVVVDQFEEIFTLCEDAAARVAFAHSLLALVQDPAATHRVILTMRSDFEPRLVSMPELQASFEEHGSVLRADMLTLSELREAIEGPARVVGLHFHREVIDALLKDVSNELAGLPLLQFTLRKLWDTKRADRITLAQYNKLGGAKGALTKSADEFYEGLVEEERTIAKGILLRMVRLGESLEVTSARIRRSVLYELGFDQAKIDNVADKLVGSGLVRVTRATTRADDQLEVAHEAIVRNWRRFVGWLETERLALLVRRRLDDKTGEWVRLGSGTAGLLDETQLKEAQKWLDTADAKKLGFHPILPLLVKKSEQAIDAARQEKELAAQKLLEQTQLAEKEQRRRVDDQAAVGRRMRRITCLALLQNVAILGGFALVLTHNEWCVTAGVISILVGIVLGGGLVLIMASRAIFSPKQPLPASRDFFGRWVARPVSGVKKIIGVTEKSKSKG